MPMTNVAVSEVSRPMANQKVSPRGVVCTAFIENFSGVHMHDTHAGANPPLLGGVKWLPRGPPFAIH